PPATNTVSAEVNRLPRTVSSSPGNASVGVICVIHGRVMRSSHAGCVNSKNVTCASLPSVKPGAPNVPGCPSAPECPSLALVQVSPLPLRPPNPPDPPEPPGPPLALRPPWFFNLNAFFATVAASVPVSTPMLIVPAFPPFPPRPPSPPRPPFPPSPPSPGSETQCQPKNQMRLPPEPLPPLPPRPPRWPWPAMIPSSPLKSRFGSPVMLFTHISIFGPFRPVAPDVPDSPGEPFVASMPSRESCFVWMPGKSR